MRLIDADATIKYLREFRCKDCDRRKGMKNGKIHFCYEIGEAPCRACDVGDTIDYFLEEDISPTIDAVPVVRCENCKYRPTYPEAYGAEIDGKWCYWCEHLKSWKPDDWFCADGDVLNEMTQ